MKNPSLGRSRGKDNMYATWSEVGRVKPDLPDLPIGSNPCRWERRESQTLWPAEMAPNLRSSGVANHSDSVGQSKRPS